MTATHVPLSAYTPLQGGSKSGPFQRSLTELDVRIEVAATEVEVTTPGLPALSPTFQACTRRA